MIARAVTDGPRTGPVPQFAPLSAGRAGRRLRIALEPPFTAIVAVIALGTLLIAVGYAGGRSGAAWGQIPFWAGQLASFVAVAVAVTSERLSDRARLAVVLLEAAQQSLLRWMYSPLFFAFPDELQHLRTTRDIVASHHLFAANPTLPISPEFPGLEELTTALSSLTHASLHTAGLLVTGTAHVTLAAAIFELARRVCGSVRVAAIAAVLFAINPDHAGFNTLFIYLGPALLFGVVALHAALAPGRRSATDLFAALACLAAVVVTHHLTAMFTIAALAAIGVAIAVQTRVGPLARRLLWLAVAGALLMAAWVSGVAPSTFSYLFAPLHNVLGGGGGHGAATAAPATGGALGTALELAGVVITAALVIAGALLSWSRAIPPQRRPLLRAFAALSLVYFAALGARAIVSDGAELATRMLTYAAVFASVPAAFALAGDHAPGRRLGRRLRPLAVAAMSIVFLGGMTGGWPPQWEVLPGRFRVDGFESGVDRQNMAAVQWLAAHGGPGRRVACDFSSCALLGAYARATPVHDASSIYYAPKVTLGVIRTIEAKQIQYVLVDRRMSTQTPITGAYFSRDTQSGHHVRPVSLRALDKFATTPGVRQVYDNGAVAIYDVRGLLHV